MPPSSVNDPEFILQKWCRKTFEHWNGILNTTTFCKLINWMKNNWWTVKQFLVFEWSININFQWEPYLLSWLHQIKHSLPGSLTWQINLARSTQSTSVSNQLQDHINKEYHCISVYLFIINFISLFDELFTCHHSYLNLK